MKNKLYFHSYVDLITNSSSMSFNNINIGREIENIKEIFDKILENFHHSEQMDEEFYIEDIKELRNMYDIIHNKLKIMYNSCNFLDEDWEEV